MAWQVEAKILVGESVDISALQTQLEERYRTMAANEDDESDQPQLPDLKPALPAEVCLCVCVLSGLLQLYLAIRPLSLSLSLSLFLSTTHQVCMYVPLTRVLLMCIRTYSRAKSR